MGSQGTERKGRGTREQGDGGTLGPRERLPLPLAVAVVEAQESISLGHRQSKNHEEGATAEEEWGFPGS